MTTHQERLEGLVKALTSDDILGAIIRVHLYIEYELNTYIEDRLPPAAFEALKLEYDKKIDLALALGLNSELKVPLRKIGTIRNNFAHNLDHILRDSDVDDLFKSFSPRLKDVTQRAFARMRKMPSGSNHPKTHHELNGAAKLQLYVVQIWSILAHFNDPTFSPEVTSDQPPQA